MGINRRMEVIMKGVQLHGIITYTECLKVAIKTPEGGSRGYPHIRRPLLTDNPLGLVKVGHTIGVYVPHSFWTLVGVLLRPTRTRWVKALWERTYGFSSLPERRFGSLTVWRCHYKGTTYFLLSCLKNWENQPQMLCVFSRGAIDSLALACLTCYPIFEKKERILFGKPVLWSASYLIKSNDNFQSGEHDVNQGTSLCLLHILSAVPDYNCNDQEHGSCNQRQLYCDGCLGGAFSASLYLFVVSVTANPTDRAFVAWFTRIV